MPQKEKDDLRADKIVGYILKLGFSSFLAILVLVGFLFSCMVIIDVQEDVYKKEVEKMKDNKYNKIIQETKREVEKYNKEASLLNKKLNERKKWKILEELNKTLPSGVFYSSLAVSSKDIKMSGFAGTREDLIKLEENLQESNFFKGAQIPISSFTSKENINFDVSLKYEKE
jgi:Tfp pilus assembly protein PilN